jgi:RNase H-fold protein (predicted Holliday junction resolvase)
MHPSAILLGLVVLAVWLAVDVDGLRLSGLGGLAGFEVRRCRVGVDYGPRVIGVASAVGESASPLGDIENDGDLKAIARKVMDTCRAEGATELLIGIPLDSNGRMSYDVKNLNGRLCLQFSSVVAAIANSEFPRLSVHLVDERYTTKEAKLRMKTGRIGGSVDGWSAACLIEHYVEDEGGGSLEARPCAYPVPDDVGYFDYRIVSAHIRDQYVDLTQEDMDRVRVQRLKEGVNPRKPLTLAERMRATKKRKG